MELKVRDALHIKSDFYWGLQFLYFGVSQIELLVRENLFRRSVFLQRIGKHLVLRYFRVCLTRGGQWPGLLGNGWG